MPVLAVVKEQELEAPIEDESKMLGVAEFRDRYFCGPLYLTDDDRTLYDFLGNKSIFSLGVKNMPPRLKYRRVEFLVGRWREPNVI